MLTATKLPCLFVVIVIGGWLLGCGCCCLGQPATPLRSIVEVMELEGNYTRTTRLYQYVLNDNIRLSASRQIIPGNPNIHGIPDRQVTRRERLSASTVRIWDAFVVDSKWTCDFWDNEPISNRICTYVQLPGTVECGYRVKETCRQWNQTCTLDQYHLITILQVSEASGLAVADLDANQVVLRYYDNWVVDPPVEAFTKTAATDPVVFEFPSACNASRGYPAPVATLPINAASSSLHATVHLVFVIAIATALAATVAVAVE